MERSTLWSAARSGSLRRSLRVLAGPALAALLVGCAGGEDPVTSGFTGYNPTNPTATNPTAPATSNDATGDASSGEASTTSPVDPTTGAPMTTGPMTTGDDTTTTTGDDSTTTTTGNNTTTTTTGNNTTTTTTTDGTSSTTDPPPPPPPKDPQPADGLYSDCANKDCNMNLTDGCFELSDAMTMMKIDGYCTLFCNSDADCFPKPAGPSVAKCVNIGMNQTVCMLSCNGLVDCPTGMTCESVNVNGQTGKYCW